MIDAGLSIFLAPAVAAALLGSLGWAAYVVALRLCGPRSVSRRWCGAAIALYWLVTTLFLLLATVHAFRLAIVLPASIGIALAAHAALGRRGSPWRELHRDARRLRCVIRRNIRGRRGLFAIPFAAIACVVLVRGAVHPPLAWDSLTYHLVRAARWVQAGGWQPMHAPDAWGYYEYYPPGGDLLWSWAMLVDRGDLFLGLAGGLVWLSAYVGAYASARALGARRTNAMAAATVVALMPALFNYITSGYVDTTTTALMLLAIPFLQQAARARPGAGPVLAMAALGLATGVKLVALPILLLSFVWVFAVSGMRARSFVAPLTYAALGLLAAAPGLPGYVRGWIERDSPFYPFGLTIGSAQLFGGNPERMLLHSGRLFGEVTFSMREFLAKVLWDSAGPGVAHAGLGVTAPLIVVLGLIAAGRLIALRRGVPLIGLLLAFIAVTLWGTFSPAELATRTFWALATARFLVLPLAILAIFAACERGAWMRIVWWVLVIAHLAMATRMSWSAAQLAAFVRGGVVVLAAAGGAWAAYRTLRPHGRAMASCAVFIALGIGAVAMDRTRQTYRYRIYADAAEGLAWNVDPLKRDYAAAWPIWRRFDQPNGVRLAVAAGWDDVGHNWYTYPLMGARLQNLLFYESPIADGSIVDYREASEVVARADASAWLRRLIADRIDYLVTLSPETLESWWAERNPDIFVPEVAGTIPQHRAYRFDAKAARRRLESLEPTDAP